MSLFSFILLETGEIYIQLEAYCRIHSLISPIWLDCSIRVYLNFALRKHEKLNNLLPQFFCVYTRRHLPDTYSSFCVIARGEFFFRIVMFSNFLFFLFFAQQVTCIQSRHWRCQIHLPNYWAIKLCTTKVILCS